MVRKYSFLLLVVAVAVGCGMQLYRHAPYFCHHAYRYRGLLVGFALFAGPWAARHRYPLLSNWFTYYGTKTHENAHEKMALLSGRRLFGYAVKEGGSGFLVYEGGPGSPFITLAPYFFSYVSLGLLLLRTCMRAGNLLYVDALIGFFLAFHTHAFLTQTRTYQTDLQKMGLAYSVAFILPMHVISYGLYIWVIGGLSALSYVRFF
jgi:hypothetical protein